MKKFLVRVQRVEYDVLEIEANTADEASEKVEADYQSGEIDSANWNCEGMEILEVEEVNV